jgi:CO dehydrogenase/acetyl-CoA synthase alpha subunit
MNSVKEKIGNQVGEYNREFIESNYNDFWRIKDIYSGRFIETGYGEVLFQILTKLHGKD